MNQPTRKRSFSAFMPKAPTVALNLIMGCLVGVATVCSEPTIAQPAIAEPATAEPATAEPVIPEPSLIQPPLRPAPKPTVKPALVTPIPVAKQLLGQWLTKEPLEGDMVMLVFAPDGKVFIITGTATSGNAIASQFQYRINDKPRPVALDVILAADATVETLFEFTANGELRLQMLGTRPGKPRPVALAENATLFQKISDDTTPPAGIELKKPSAQAK